MGGEIYWFTVLLVLVIMPFASVYMVIGFVVERLVAAATPSISAV